MSEIDKDGKQDAGGKAKIAQPRSCAPRRPQGVGTDAGHCGNLRRRAVLRAVEAQPRVVADGAEKAAGHRPHDGRERPVRRERHGRTSRRDDGDQGIQRQGRRAGPADRGAAHGFGDDARDRFARRGADDHAQRRHVPGRRASLRRRQRHFAGGPEIRLHLPEHQFEFADGVGQGLPPRQVRLGRQRHQLRAGDRQERDGRERQELGAADQRLRLGPQYGEGDAHDRRGQWREDRRGNAGAAEHARLLVVSAQDPADQARRGRRRRRR